MAIEPHVEDREKVQTHLGVNMVVEAGAGTGKTTLLIQRLCLAVLAQGRPIEKIVALTFTEKAAAEIKNRLVTALHRIIRDIQTTPPAGKADNSLLELLRQKFALTDPVILTRAQEALMHLDRSSIGTIHSFCADILKTFPLEAGLSPQAEIDPGPKAEHLFEVRWNAFLDKELGLEASRAELWKAVLPEISLDELKDFAKELCSGKIEQYDYFSHAAMLAGICEEKARQALAWSTAYLDPKKPSPRQIEKALSWAGRSLQSSAAFLRGADPEQDPAELPPALPSAAVKGWEEDAFEEARGLVQFALKIRPQQQRIFRQALSLVEGVSAQIRADYAREGILSFDDLIVKTRNLVQHDLYVRRLLKEKFDLLFIDEFQDTDPVQGELLLFLAEEKTSSAVRWQDVRLAPGKLLVVGDPKQSIYRFRGADITAYEFFTQLILDQGGEKCFLRQNFRSTPPIVDTANAVCRRAMVQQTAFQPAYEPIFPAKAGGKDSVQWLFVRPSKEGALADDFRANQAQCIAQWIEQHVGKQVLANGEKLAYKDIAILFRASTTLAPYTHALRRHGIAFNTEGEKDFFQKQEIHDLLNFLQLIDNPEDKTALVGVLRSPLGGYTDEEIYQISRRGELCVSAPTKDPDLARLYALVTSLAKQAAQMSVSHLIETVLEKTFLPEACAGAYDADRTLELLTQWVRQVPALIGERPTSLGQFLQRVRERLEQAPEQFNTVSNQTANAVSVMTVHKSKGLDFPVVILADLSRREAVAASSVQHLFSWQYNMHGLRAGKICDANLAFLEEEQRKHERCEEVRILYVALTRAKEKMILTADGRKGAEKAAAAFLAAGLFPDGTKTTIDTQEVSIPVTYVDYKAPEQFLYQHKPGEEVSSVSLDLPAWRQLYEKRYAHYQTLLAQEVLSPSRRVQEGADLSGPQQAGAEVGTVCHRALQILYSQPAVTVAAAVRQAALETALAEREAPAAQIILPFSQTALFDQLKTCELLAAEMPFSFLSEKGAVETGIMDALFKAADGSIWVVDYKTDQIPAQGPQALLEKYRPQLAVYQQAAQRLFPELRVQTLLVLLRTGAAIPLVGDFPAET